jgi:hypothetical protein
VDLYWLPLGAGGHSVRLNGRAFEAVVARLEGRAPCDLYWAGRFRIFRYEVRCWYGGVIPDIGEAVASPQRLTGDLEVARRVLDLAPDVPTAVWGRDELAAGEMWNSNSIIAWLIASCGIPAESVHPPAGGRAPGWRAGLVVARRQQAPPDSAGRGAPCG